ncbi:hypothetical protein [Legionella fairfieldensis]|nr:hypothetical protein [Legionella fairfieldensis]
MEQKGQNETLLIALTKTAEQRISNFQSSSLVLKHTLSEILSVENFSVGLCTKDQLDIIIQYIKDKNINYAYFGVPSVSNEIPFQIAEALEDTPILMAYEFMFKPETHCLWEYVPKLKSKPNVHWALPLADAIDDFEIDDVSKVHITGHLSLNNAYSYDSTRNSEEIRERLQVSTSSTLAFVSSTTQPVITDIGFLECLLAELPGHPNVQVRFGLHPGIQDLDSYVSAILAVYERHSSAHEQFKIILPDNLLDRFKRPAFSINHPLLQHAFLRININGADASFAADRVAQAVPGALLNQSVIEGKPSYAHSGKPYLPKRYFSNNLAAFFSETRKTLREKADLGLNGKSVYENYVDIIAG